MDNQTFWIVLLGLALVVGSVLFVFVYLLPRLPKRKKVDKEEKEEEEEEIDELPVFARVRDNFDGHKTYNTTLSPKIVRSIKEKHSTLGIQESFRGKLLYTFCRISEDDYVPYYKYLTPDRSHPPSALYRYIHQPEIAISRNVQKKQGFMEKYGGLLPWTVAIAFIIFMIVASK